MVVFDIKDLERFEIKRIHCLRTKENLADPMSTNISKRVSTNSPVRRVSNNVNHNLSEL